MSVSFLAQYGSLNISGTPPRGMARTYGWTHPYNRIRQWYIWKGDSVRLNVGPDHVKYENAELGAKGGYKVYKVIDVSRAKNRVYLEELTVSAIV